MVRVDGYHIFASAENIKEAVIGLIKNQNTKVKYLILDFKYSPIIDVTGVDMLKELCDELKVDGVQVKIAHVSGQVRDFIRAAGLENYFGHIKTNTHVNELINEIDVNGEDFKFK